MAKIRTIQIYRGTTAQNDAYTGSAGELTMDTTNNEIRIHDGSTAGGHIIYTKSDVDTSLSGKANTNLSNITAAGKEVCAKMSMPSSSYDELTLGVSGTTYTAPADGYVCVGGYNDSAPTGSITVQNVSAATLRMISNAGQGEWGCVAFIPVKKGDTFKVSYANISVWLIKRFIYAQGEA